MASTKSQTNNLSDIKQLTNGFNKLIKVVSSVVDSLNRSIEELVNNNQIFMTLSKSSNIPLSTLQKWNTIGESVGIDNAMLQLVKLEQKLYEVQTTKKGLEDFESIGINPLGKDVETVLEELRDLVAGMDNVAASAKLMQIGLDSSMTQLLKMDPSKFKEMADALNNYQLNEGQLERMTALNQELTIADQKIQNVQDKIALNLMPLLVDLKNIIADIVVSLSDVLKWFAKSDNGWAKFSRWLTAIIGGFTALLALVNSFSAALNVVFGALKALAVNPIFLAIAGILMGGIAIWDYVNHLLNGGKSLSGRIINGVDDDNEGVGINNLSIDPVKRVDTNKFPDKNRSNRQIAAQIAIKKIQKMKEEGKKLKYMKVKEILETPYSPPVLKSADNLTSSVNSNNTIYQNNYITTQQPIEAMKDQLAFAQYAFDNNA